MDRLLPSPANASPASPVPLLEGFDYFHGQGDFRTLGGVERVLRDGTRSGVSFHDVRSLRAADQAACVQAWLFFGLLSAFLDRHVRKDPFLKRDNAQPSGYIVAADPAVVSALFEEWTHRLAQLSTQELADKLADRICLLKFAAAQCDVFDSMRCTPSQLDRDRDVRSLAAVLLSVRLLISYLRASAEAVKQTPRLGDTVLNVMKILDTSRRNTTNRESGDKFKPIPEGGQVSLSALLLLTQFRENRWCPVRARRLCELHDYTIVSYLSRVSRVDPENVNHDSCDGQTRCRAYNLDSATEAAYQPKHTVNGCTCELRGVDLGKLAKMISHGHLPILSMDPKASDLDIKLHKYNGTQQYTAISHVWSDGLGNPHKNALPACQLRRIALTLKNMEDRSYRYMGRVEKYVGKLSTTLWSKSRVYFWMDTLCVPVEAPSGSRLSLHEIKLKAIKHITPTMEAADRVLVFDSELEQLALKSPDDDEMTEAEMARHEEILAAKILGSKWLQRAWTLEEGSLARDCDFKVAGDVTTVTLGELLPPEETHKDGSRERKRKAYWKKQQKAGAKVHDMQQQQDDLEAGYKLHLAVTENSMDTDMTPHFESPLKLLLQGPLNEKRKQAIRAGKGKRDARRFQETRASQFIGAWNELLDRSATKPADDLIILANIMDFNGASIHSIQPVESRLPKIVRSSKVLPLGLFFNTTPSSQEGNSPQDSWIPTAIEGDPLTEGAVLVRGKKDGMLRLDLSERPESLFALRVRPKIPFHARYVLIEIVKETGSGEQYIVEMCAPAQKSIANPWYQRLKASYEEGEHDSCLLLFDTETGSSSTNGYTARGARLGVLSSGPKELQVRYSTALTVWTPEQWLQRPGPTAKPQYSLRCEHIEETQILCLDQDVSMQADTVTQRPLLKPRSLHAGLWRYLIGLLISSTITSFLIFYFLSICSTSSDSNDLSDPPKQSSDSSDVAEKCKAEEDAIHVFVSLVISVALYYAWKLHRWHMYHRWLRTFNVR